MRILIINLPRYNGISVTREGRCEMLMKYRVDTPSILLTLASILRESHHIIDFIDANGLNLNFNDISELINNKKYKCAIFTIASQILDHDLKFCDIIKDIIPTCITIGYSWYAKKYSEEILIAYSHLDILLIEDPYSVIENLINSLNSNQDLSNVGGIVYRNNNREIIINPELKSLKKFDDLPIPAYDLITTFKPYYIYTPSLSPYALVYAGKGCPFSCKYCNVANTIYSARSAENIIKELKLLKKIGNVKYIWFFDEIFTINRKRVIKICNLMIKEKINIKWLCDSRVDLIDLDLLKLMKKAGCIGISYGVESGSQKILEAMKKGITIEQAKKAILWTKKVGIPVQLNLIVGYMGETVNTLRETEIFIKETSPNLLQITKMMVLADTEFYDIALERGWIKEDLNWKIGLSSSKTQIKNYKPYNLDLWGEMKRLKKKLYLSPKWWVLTLKTLVKNPYLLSLAFETIIKKAYNKNIL